MPQDRNVLAGQPSQIALPLGSASATTSQRLVIGNANAHVIEALADPASWPYHVAVLTGPPRSGKSLIGQWAAQQTAAMPVAVIDNAEKSDETELFHRWNAVQETGKHSAEALLLIVNSGAGDAGWHIALPDLASRIGGSLHLAIAEPDDAMAAQLIEQWAAQRRLSLPHGAVEYLVPRATRSYAALEALVATIDRISLERQTPATMSVWRAALEALQGPEQQALF